GEEDRLFGVQIHVHEAAAGGAVEDADVFVVGEVQWQIVHGQAEVLPGGNRRNLPTRLNGNRGVRSQNVFLRPRLTRIHRGPRITSMVASQSVRRPTFSICDTLPST